MCSLPILYLTVMITAASATTYGFDEIPADQSKLINLLMAMMAQNAEPETGQCGNHCYIVNGEEKFVLKDGGKYTNPNVPCETYQCTTNGVIKGTIKCKSVDDLEPCPNGGRVVVLPDQCCTTCETPDPPTDRLTEWEEWTACSKSCGRGAQARKRECMIAENGTSVYCVGEKIQVQDCNAQPCLVKCVWKEWSAWSPCSVTCGAGTEERTREPISAYYYGPNCEGDSSDTRACHLQSCENPECPATHSVCSGLCIPDVDHDCIDDTSDNCPKTYNTGQLDNDKDEIGNACDNCESKENVDQSDNDKDEEGDACDDDSDNDGISDRFDNCRFIANIKQLESEIIKECNITGNGIIIDEESTEEKKGLIAEIMQLLFQLYTTK